MSRRAAIQKHLDNLFVYTRDYKPDGTFDVRLVKGAEAESEADKAYYREVRAFVRKQLEHVPDDILLASVEERVGNGKVKSPLALYVVLGDKKGVAPEEYDHYPAADTTGWHDPDMSKRVTYPPFQGRRAIIGMNWSRANAAIDAAKRLSGEGGNYPLIHEFAHHWLDCCLTKAQRRQFMDSFLKAVEQDKAHVGHALKNRVNVYKQRENYSPEDEYFGYAVEMLFGGESKRDGNKVPHFNFEHCPNVLNVLLEHHPGWIKQVSNVAPVFAAKWKDAHGIKQEINDSWAEAVADRDGYTPWAGRG